MSADAEGLRAECRTMTRHLIGIEPSDYVTDSYISSLEAISKSGSGQGIDRPLLRVARMGRWGSALADAYSGLFVRTGLTRTRFVLLYSILESTAPYHERLDRVPAGGMLRLIWIGVVSSAAALCASVLFGPVHLVVGGSSSTTAGADG